MRAHNESLWDVIRACEHYGVFLTPEQESEAVRRVQEGEQAREVVGGTWSLRELGEVWTPEPCQACDNGQACDMHAVDVPWGHSWLTASENKGA